MVPFLCMLTHRRLTAAYSILKALALPWLVAKVQDLCSRGSVNIVEQGVPDSDFIVRWQMATNSTDKFEDSGGVWRVLLVLGLHGH